jgi:hypothetical protein
LMHERTDKYILWSGSIECTNLLLIFAKMVPPPLLPAWTPISSQMWLGR